MTPHSCMNCLITQHIHRTIHFVTLTTHYTFNHTHTQDTTLNALYWSHYDWYLIIPSIYPLQHWIPSSLHSTVDRTFLLPPFTPYIIANHSHYTHHPLLLLISQTHNHYQLHIALHTPSITTQHSTSNTLNTQSTAWLSHYAACSCILDWMPLWTHAIFYCAPIHEYIIPHHWMPLSRQNW